MAYSILQSVLGAVSTAATCTATYTSNLSPGSKLIAFVSEDINVTFYPSGVALNDTAATALANIAEVLYPSTTGGLSVWVVDTPSDAVGTKPTVTATLSGSFGSVVGIMEVSGLALGSTAAAVIDGTYGTDSGSASPAVSGAYSDNYTGELLVGVVGDPGNTTTYTVSGGSWSQLFQTTANSAAQLVVGTQNSAGTGESFSWAISGAATWGSILFAFKLAAATGTPGPVQSPQTWSRVAVIGGRSGRRGASHSR